MTQGQGFTLFELIVTVSLLAVLSSLAIPPFSDLLARSQISATSNLLLSHIQLARIRSILDSSTVVICPTHDGQTCQADSTNWSSGWMVFRDSHYQLPLRLEASDDILAAHHSSKHTTVSTTLSHVRYSPNGSASNGTLVLCSQRKSSSPSRAVIISITGRARVSGKAADGSVLNCPSL